MTRADLDRTRVVRDWLAAGSEELSPRVLDNVLREFPATNQDRPHWAASWPQLSSFALGAAAGLLGDRWSLGFLAETERQVEKHLEVHLERLPEGDRKSRAILSQMQTDEAGHSVNARRQGGSELPAPVRGAMRVASRIMTAASRWI